MRLTGGKLSLKNHVMGLAKFWSSVTGFAVSFLSVCVRLAVSIFFSQSCLGVSIFFQGHNEGLEGSRRADLFVYVL